MFEPNNAWVAATHLPDLRKESITDVDGSIYHYLVSEWVLVYTEDGNYATAQYEDDGDGRTAWVSEGGSTLAVTHWMELPSAPEVDNV